MALFGGRAKELELRVHELENQVRELTNRLESEQASERKLRMLAENQKEMARIAASIGAEQSKKLAFFTNLAQEFRTPLTLILALIENARTGSYGPVVTGLEKQFEIMRRNARQMLRLVNQFHDISTLETGALEMNVRQVELVQFLKEIAVSLSWQWEKKAIDFQFESTTDEIDIFIDDEKMEEVFRHLISNAFKFTPERGVVRVTVSEKSQGDDEVVEITIRDSGKGIPEQELPYLFDLFESAGGMIEHKPHVGLALLKQVIQQHNGKIAVNSALNEGTQFIITLPSGVGHWKPEVIQKVLLEITAEDIFPEAVLAATASATLSGEVLVVDDNPDIRDLIKGCLASHYHVREAAGGKEALESVREHPPDLIISDIMMPEMDGYDLCRVLKNDDSFRAIPIVLLSARSSEAARVEGRQAGADDFIAKPFGFDELLEMVEKHIRTKTKSESARPSPL